MNVPTPASLCARRRGLAEMTAGMTMEVPDRPKRDGPGPLRAGGM